MSVDNPPPVREHVRWVYGSSKGEPWNAVGACVMVRSHDAGDADRAASVYARTVLKVTNPVVTPNSDGWVRMGWTKIPTEPSVQLRPFPRSDRQVVRHTRKKGVQAKHISDEVIMLTWAKGYEDQGGQAWASTGYIYEHLKGWPYYVVFAKLNIMAKRRGYFQGCNHRDYRGDWELTEKGREFVLSILDRIDQGETIS